MKVRSGFVSNSSSSSFLIYGISETASELIIKMNENLASAKENDVLAEHAKKLLIGDFNGDDYDMLYEIVSKDFDIYIPHGNEVYIGKSWDEISDDETGAEFKKTVQSRLTKIFGDVDCRTHQEAWFDG